MVGVFFGYVFKTFLSQFSGKSRIRTFLSLCAGAIMAEVLVGLRVLKNKNLRVVSFQGQSTLEPY